MKTNNQIFSIENYKKELDAGVEIIFFKYISVIHEFIEGCLENIYVKDKEYFLFIIINGIKILNHIFSILLLYTNNIELTNYHTSKALFYYIEFISQIGNDGNAFLKLSVKDASLFLLKKTIFEIDETHRKNFKQSKNSKQINNLKDKYICLYNNIIVNIINNFKEYESNKIELLKIITRKLYKISELLIQTKNFETNYDLIDHFINFMLKYEYNLPYIEIFLKKINKKTDNIQLSKFISKLSDENIKESYNTMTASKFVNYIIS